MTYDINNLNCNKLTKAEVFELVRNAKKRYQEITETIRLGVEDIDIYGNILYANTRLHSMLKYDEGELNGQSIFDLCINEAEKGELRFNLQFLVDEQPEPMPYIKALKRNDGAIIDVEVVWNYKRDSKNRVVGFTSIITDLTESRKKSETLRFYNEVVENIGEGVSMVSPITGKILYTNPAMNQMFGYGSEELLHQHSRILNGGNEDMAKKTHKDIAKKLETDGSWRGEVYSKKKDGSRFWTESTVRAFNHSIYGRVWLTLQKDISEQKQSEQLLRASETKLKIRKEQLKDKNTTLSEILTGIEKEKKKVERTIASNIQQILIPLIDHISLDNSPSGRQYIELIKSSLHEISAPLSGHHGLGKYGLTPKEIEVANLIRNGLRNKEIARFLKISFKTVTGHREKIRKKLGLTFSKKNLAGHLQELANSESPMDRGDYQG